MELLRRRDAKNVDVFFTYEEDISVHDDVEFTLGSRYSFITCPQCKEEIKLEVTR